MPAMIANLAFRFLRKIERGAAFLRGRGYGTHSVEREARTALRLLGRAPKLVLDVGANVGSYAAAIRRLAPQAEIHMFEPSEVCGAKLRERFAADELATVEAVALSDYEGSGTLFADEEGSALASLSRRNLDHIGITMDTAEAVRVMRLERYWESVLGSRDIDFVKIDVEGHELAVLKGFGQALARTSVIQFEFGGTQIDTRHYFKDYFEFFRDAGFRLWRISPLGLESVDRYSEAEENFLIANYMAARRWD
jgi:FkbM family methyltransferase